MAASNEEELFQSIPKKFKCNEQEISNPQIKKILSSFEIKYHNYQEKDENYESSLFKFLKQFHFITYEIVSSSYFHIDSTQKYFVIICVEKKCILIETDFIKQIHDILKKINTNILNSNNEFDFDFELIGKNGEVVDEISSFCEYYTGFIKNIEYIKIIIRSMSAFLICRYFYPSKCFTDQSFFSFGQEQNQNESDQYKNFYYFDIIEKIKNDQKELKKNYEFQYNDFIKLRQICHNKYATFDLVIHKETFYIFLMKKIFNHSDRKPIDNEINFCENYSYRCFTSFYGFLKEKSKITGFIYEFMSNGQLDKFINNHKEEIDEKFIYSLMFRIVGAIKYFNTKNIIHRDLKPGNILIDHDNKPYISDFDLIKEINGEYTYDIGNDNYTSPEMYGGKPYSFPIDIYSFGKIMNDLIKIVEIEKNEIKYLIQKCVRERQEERPNIDDIIKILFDEFSSFYFLKPDFLNGIKNNIENKWAHQFFVEVYFLLFVTNKADEHFIKWNNYSIFSLLRLVVKFDISTISFVIGYYFYVKGDYIKAQKEFEYSAELNNPFAQHFLGKMYNFGNGVSQNYIKAKEFYEMSISQNCYYSLNNLGFLYFKGQVYIQDIEKVKDLFEQGVKHNCPFAQYNLPRLYKSKFYWLQMDIPLALYYFKLSAEQGNTLAYYQIGKIYYFEKYKVKNDDEAIKYLKLSSAENNPKAQFLLGLIYKNDKKDYVQSIKFFELSARQGNINALYELGKYYFEMCDYKKSSIYFYNAYKKRNINASYYLGLMYKNGLGIDPDLDKAIEYFTQNATNKQEKYMYYNKDCFLSFEEKHIINHFYYISNTNLALIYLFEKNNREEFKKCIGRAKYNGYSLADYVYDLYRFIFENDTENLRLFTSSPQEKFALSFFIRSIIHDKDGEEERCISFLNKASDLENEQLSFKDYAIYDERLDISKSFILSYSNLKLYKYHLSKNIEVSIIFFLKSLFRPLFRLLFQTKKKSYSFTFQTTYDKEVLIITNLKDFILNNPLYHLNSKSFTGWKIIDQKENIELKIQINGETKKKSVKLIKNSKNYIIENTNYIQNNFIEDCTIDQYKDKIVDIFNYMNNANKFELINSNDIQRNNNIIKIKRKGFDDFRYLKYPKCLSKILLNTLKSDSQLIQEILEDMKKFLFNKPYQILFGRMPIPKDIPKIPEINQVFYTALNQNLKNPII